MILQNGINKKNAEIDARYAEQQVQISNVEDDTKKLDNKTEKYESLTARLDEIEAKNKEVSTYRQLIPNLLSEIMFSIPEKVEIDEIKNTSGKKIEITASATDYDQLH